MITKEIKAGIAALYGLMAKIYLWGLSALISHAEREERDVEYGDVWSGQLDRNRLSTIICCQLLLQLDVFRALEIR